MTEVDCGTDDGMIMNAVIEGGDVIAGLGCRVLAGCCGDVYNCRGMRVLMPRGHVIDEKWADRVRRMGIDEIKVEVPLRVRHATVFVVIAMVGIGPWPLSQYW